MTTTTTAASNGSTDTTAGPPGSRRSPSAWPWSARPRPTTTPSVLHDAVFEADRLCTAIHHAVSDAYFRDVREDQARTPA